MTQADPDLSALLPACEREARKQIGQGRVANYIPALARINPNQFGMAVCGVDGREYVIGDSDAPFSIQSISKVFTLALALQSPGAPGVWQRVGREPSGNAFNSLVQLESEQGLPRNPFINAGAIVTTDAVLSGHAPREFLGEFLRFIRAAARDDDIHINDAVAQSEQSTGNLNRALAYFMQSHDNLENPPELALGAYFHQCAVEMTCVQLARAGLFLTGAPQAPKLVSEARQRRINALMMLCGHYDASGDFAYRVGLPGKSGVGGGIMVVAPGKAAIAVWSPGLNAQGNSKLGTEAIEILAHRTGWSVFG